MFLCIWFVLLFLGHHLCAVLFFNSMDKVASFGFQIGTISSGVYVCVCFPPCILLIQPLTFVQHWVCIYYLLNVGNQFFLVAVFPPLLLFLLAIMAKYRQAAKPLIIIINSEDPNKEDGKCLRSAIGTRNSSRMPVC